MAIATPVVIVASMKAAGRVTRLFTLPAADRRLLFRAYWTLASASLRVALLPFPRAIAFGATPLGSGQLPPGDVGWAVAAAARRLPLRTKCIEQGVAVQRLLRQSGHPAVLHYGVRDGGQAGPLQAHVWVTLDDRPVVGGEEASGFRQVATFP